MEEHGINAKAQVSFANQRRRGDSKIITGSMRTVEGLKWVCEYDTVPTIGSRVWDKLLEESSAEEFVKFWDNVQDSEDAFSPTVKETMISLSESFFAQMDKLGRPVYEEFVEVIRAEVDENTPKEDFDQL